MTTPTPDAIKVALLLGQIGTEQITFALIGKGLLTPVEGARILTKAADAIRTGTERDESRTLGEMIAPRMKDAAADLLRFPPGERPQTSGR